MPPWAPASANQPNVVLGHADRRFKDAAGFRGFGGGSGQ